MRIFMLGWEFPPFISGGLGTACFGLTRALSRADVDVTFVLPKAIGTDFTSHVTLLSPQSATASPPDEQRTPEEVASTYALPTEEFDEAFEHVSFKAVPARMLNPYQSVRRKHTGGDARFSSADQHRAALGLSASSGEAAAHGHWRDGGDLPYGGDLIQECYRYAALCVDLARGQDFDVVHAHDWMTYPAGVAVAASTGKPLVVHVHSTEYDRAGEHPNETVFNIERQGMLTADRVIAVSHMTKSICQHRYGCSPMKIDVVYNGVDNGTPVVDHLSRAVIKRGDKIVLFLGRFTFQKGPEYFVRAAKRVLSKYEKVKFVMAGSGDKFDEVIDLAEQEGIADRVLFTGFLHGKDVEKVFKAADVYVMPSVSEPFGIAPLEAISHDVPVIISKQSGVSEVLQHALKVDFWDTDEIANKIIAVLRHPPLSSTLRQHADIEVRRLTWADAADKTMAAYERAVKASRNGQ